MDISISYKSEKSLYEQVFEQISSQIIKGTLPADYCLPSIRTVAKELGISIITVKKAYELLEFNGFIYTRAGKGCYVSPATRNKLENKKFELALEKLKKDVEYYKSLNISLNELIEILKREY